MSTFDASGLTIDRLEDIKTEMEASLRDAFGNGIDLDERSPFGILVGIMSERYSLLNEKLEAVNDASYPGSSFGVYLDQISAFNGVIREQATASVADLTFTRQNGSSGAVIIPAGTQVYAEGSTVLWATDEEVSILDAEDTALVQATANDTGPIAAVAGTLTVMVSAPGQVESVTNLTDATLGQDQETDAELKLRREDQVARAGTATESGIKSALNLLDAVRTNRVVVNDTDVEVDSQPPHSVAAYISPETGINFRQDSELEFSSDILSGQSAAINLNGSPIAGSPLAFDTDNDTTLDNIATALQAEALISTAVRNGSSQIDVDGTSGEASVITIVMSGGGALPTVTQSFVGTDLDSIAQALWDSKAAGIQTYGDLSGTAIDEEGDPQTMYFSQVETLDIEVQYTLSVDSDFDAVTSEPAIKQAAVDYGVNNLTPGVDVLSYKLLCAASDVGASGIRTLSCGVREVGGGSFIDEVVVPVSSVGNIETNNVTFVYV